MELANYSKSTVKKKKKTPQDKIFGIKSWVPMDAK